MSNERNSEQFIHWHWYLDEEEYVWCFMLVELSNGHPDGAYDMPITKPFLQCHIYAFIRSLHRAMKYLKKLFKKHYENCMLQMPIYWTF